MVGSWGSAKCYRSLGGVGRECGIKHHFTSPPRRSPEVFSPIYGWSARNVSSASLNRSGSSIIKKWPYLSHWST